MGSADRELPEQFEARDLLGDRFVGAGSVRDLIDTTGHRLGYRLPRDPA